MNKTHGSTAQSCGTLSVIYLLAATGNSTHGYFGGGSSPVKSIVDKLTYSSDTTAAVPSANLSQSRTYLAATGNSTHGYFGGNSSPVTSIVDKLTYSSDTTAALPSGANLSEARYDLSASGARDEGRPTAVQFQILYN